jgi:hypothetical protein
MISIIIHAVASDRISFIFMHEYYSIVYSYLIFLIHSSADEYLGCFHLSAAVNSTAMSIGV